jgi:putative lipoprotein
MVEMKRWGISMSGLVRVLLSAFAVILTLGTASAETLTLSGEVTYRERIALPDNGTLRISLVDLAAPAQPRVQAQGAIASPGQVPLSFTLNFESSVIARGQNYGLRAEIVSAGQVWFRNDTPLALDLAAPDNIEIIVTFTGRIDDPASRPAIDPSPILDVNWTAEEVGGVAVKPGDSTLSIAADMRAGGRGGCNSYFTQAQISAERLAFSSVAATRMACAETVMAQEAVFFDALTATRFWRLESEKLLLLNAGGAIVMRLAKAVR